MSKKPWEVSTTECDWIIPWVKKEEEKEVTWSHFMSQFIYKDFTLIAVKEPEHTTQKNWHYLQLGEATKKGGVSSRGLHSHQIRWHSIPFAQVA